MKLKYTIFIVITFFMNSNSMAEKMIIDDMKNQSGVPDEEFCESGNAKWCFVTDKVMGGVSNGSLEFKQEDETYFCLLYTSPSPRDWMVSRMPSSA